MANIWEKAISVLAGNLNSGLSYLITTVLFMKNVSPNARIWRIQHGHEYWISTKQ